LVAVGAAAVAVAPGCAKNDESIYVQAVLAPSTSRTNGCTYTNDPTQPTLGESTLDVAIRSDYIAVLLVANQMIPRGDPTDPRTESNKIHINGAVVHVTTVDDIEVSPEFTSYSSGQVIVTQNNGNPGFAAISVAIADGRTADAFRNSPNKDAIAVPPDLKTFKEFKVMIRVFGKTLGGVDVESGEYQHIMKVCNGCLIKFDAVDPATGVCSLNASAAPAAGGAASQPPCFDGQDEKTSCTACIANPICKKPPA
jgi:hypothetical protein